MAHGVIKSFDLRKGSGIIAPDDGSPDITLHVSEVERAGLAHVLIGEHIFYERRYDRGRQLAYATNLALIP